MNEMVRNRNQKQFDKSKAEGMINVQNINFTNKLLSYEIKSSFINTPKQGTSSKDNERAPVFYNENNPTGGLTVSHKIRNSSLQPYKNKITEQEERKTNLFGAMIKVSNFKGHTAKKGDEMSSL